METSEEHNLKEEPVSSESLQCPDALYLSGSSADIWRLCLERKKIGWETLKGWDENSKHNLQINKVLIESLFSRLEKTLAESYRRYAHLFEFFDSVRVDLSSQVQFHERLSLFKLDADALSQSRINMHKSKKGKDAKVYNCSSYGYIN